MLQVSLLQTSYQGTLRQDNLKVARSFQPLFFDGGATLTISTAALANALVAKGLIAAKLGIVGGLLASRGSNSSHRRSYSGHHRGKRSVRNQNLTKPDAKVLSISAYDRSAHIALLGP